MRFEDDSEVAQALGEDLATADQDRRVASVLRAGREGGARCVALLAEALPDAQERVRSSAAHALGLLALRARDHGDPPIEVFSDATPALIAAARDESAEVRRGALAVLVSLESAAAGPAFAEALEDDNPGVRIEAVRGLWRVGGQDAGRRLLPLLSDLDALVRYYAILAVAELNPPGTDAALAACMDDPRVEVAAEAGFLLAERGDQRAVGVLCRALRHRDLGFEAARLLGELGAPEAVAELRSFVGRWFADPLTRMRAVASLHRLGDPGAEAMLLRGLRSWRRPVRGFAMELLAEFRVEAAWESIIAVAQNPRDYHCGSAARALGVYGDARATEVLAFLLAEHPDSEVREDAARALARVGGAQARSALQGAAQADPNETVRDTAQQEKGRLDAD